MKRSRRRKKFSFDPTLWLAGLVPLSLVLMVLSLLAWWLHWLLLLGATLDLLGAAALMLYIATFIDNENTSLGVENAPRTFLAGMIFLLGVAQIMLYLFLAHRWDWR